MKFRIILAFLGLAALAFVAVQAQENPGKKPVDKVAEIRESLSLREQILARQFAEFQESLLKLKQRLQHSPKQEDRDRALVLERALDKIKDASISTKFEQLVEFLKTQKLSSVGEIKTAAERSNKLAEDLRELLALLREDSRASKLRDERLRLEELLKKIEQIIHDQKVVQGQTDLGKTDRIELKGSQAKVTDATAKVAKQMAGRDGQGGEGKNSRGEIKGEGKDGGKKGEGKDMGKGAANKGTSKEAGKGGEAKSGEAKGDKGGKGGEGKQGDAKSGSGKEGGAKDSKGGEGKQGDPKSGGSGKEGGAKDAKGGEGKQGAAKGGDKGGKGGDGKPGEAKGGKGGEAGKEGGAKSGGKGGEAKKGGDSKGGGQGGDGKPGEAKGGDSKGGQASAKGSGQQSGQPPQGQQSGSKGDDGGQKSGQQPPPNGSQQPQDNIATGKKKVEDANYKQKQAEDNIAKGQNKPASEDQGKAIQDLEQAKKKLEELLRQLREEELERLLAALQARCERMLAMQIAVLNGTELTANAIAAAKDKKPGRDEQQRSLKLSDDEKEIVVEATKAMELLEAEGSAVAFPEVFHQVREDMKHVQRRLGVVDVGPVTQAIERDIIDTLKEMIEALKKAKQELDQKKSPPGQPGQPPPNQDQKLLDQIAELKMIRSMQMRVNARTQIYGRQYQEREGEQTADPNIRLELNNLAERQERIFDITNRIAKGDNK